MENVKITIDINHITASVFGKELNIGLYVNSTIDSFLLNVFRNEITYTVADGELFRIHSRRNHQYCDTYFSKKKRFVIHRNR